MDKIIYEKLVLKCKPNVAFEMFTKNANLEKWLTHIADVEPKAGGKYELFWDPSDKNHESTIGCKVLAIEKDRFINFEWKGPQQYEDFMNFRRPLTNVTVFFYPIKDSTEVNIMHTGWGDDEKWEEARQWFVRAWQMTLSELKKIVNGN